MSNALSWLLSLTGFVLVAYAMLDSACFAIYGPLRPAQDDYLKWDGLLCLLFVVAHSGLVWTKSFFSRAIYAAVYAGVSAVVLLICLRFWVPGPVVWTVEHSRALPAVQAYALFIIVCQGLLLDPELAVGIKQAAYRGLGLRDPLSYATTQMQSLTNNMRHPIVLAPIVALLAVRAVTWDRLLLALGFFVYMLIANRPTYSDAQYVAQRLKSKVRHFWRAWPL